MMVIKNTKKAVLFFVEIFTARKMNELSVFPMFFCFIAGLLTLLSTLAYSLGDRETVSIKTIILFIGIGVVLFTIGKLVGTKKVNFKQVQ